MRRTTAITAGLLAAVLVTGPVSAGPPYTGDTHLQGPPTSGATLFVEASITSDGPVVPYEFAIQNECQLPNKGGRTMQRDDIVEWTYHVDNVPHTVMPIHLQSVPAGSKCKVILVRGNTQVKGSATSYVVE